MKFKKKTILVILIILIVFTKTIPCVALISEPSDSLHYDTIFLSEMKIIIYILFIFCVITSILLIVSIIKKKKSLIIIFSIFLLFLALSIFFIPIEKNHITGGIAGVNKYEYNNIFSIHIYIKDNKKH